MLGMDLWDKEVNVQFALVGHFYVNWPHFWPAIDGAGVQGETDA